MLKLMIAVIVLMTFSGGFHLCYGDKLKCDFINFNFNIPDYSQYNGLYSCQVTSLDNSNIIDGYTGVHMANKYVSDVKGIWIHHTYTKLIPDDLGQLFNLISFSFDNSQLNEIKADNFLGMQELEVLKLHNNSLTSVSSNAFSYLPKLKYINLNYNQISEIPSGLFTNNLKLEQIHLYGNKIKFLSSGVFGGLSKLNIVDHRENICEINQHFVGTIMIGEMKNEMKSKCKNPNDPHEIVINLKEEKKELIKDKEALGKEKNALKKNYDALKSELSAAMKLQQRNEIELIKLRDDLKKEQSVNLKVKNERDALMSEKDSLKSELINKTTEINELKTNCKNSNEDRGAVEMKFNEIMYHLSKASQEHQMECNEIIKLRAELISTKDELKMANDQQKKEQLEYLKVTKERDQLDKKLTEEFTDLNKKLSEAKEIIDDILPKMNQTIEDFYLEVFELKIERHYKREDLIALRSKLMESNEQLAECKSSLIVDLRSSV